MWRVIGKVSNLPIVKTNTAQRNNVKPRNRIDTMKTTTARNKDKRKKSKTQMRIATWNIRSLNTRDQEITQVLKEKQIDICALQETKKKGKGQSKLGEYILIYSGVAKENRAKEGVALLIHQRYQNHIKECQYVSERIVTTKIRMEKEDLNIIGVYGPENNKPQTTRETFYEELQQVVDQVRGKMIILGDFNARIGHQVIPGIKQKHNENVKNENGELMINFCTNNELRINNTFFDHKDQHKYTFNNTRGQRSMIDYVITNRDIHPSKIIDVRCLNSADVGSDHSLVLCKIRIILKYFTPKRAAPTQKKIRVEGLNTESTEYLYRKRISEKIAENEILENDSIEESWEKLKNNITNAATESLGERKVTNTNISKKKTPWFREEVKTKCEEKKKAFLQYRTQQTQQAYNHYKRIRNETNTLVRQIKQEHWQSFSKQMEHDFYGTQKEIWRMIRGQRKEMNELIKTKHIQKETWADYFRSLFAKVDDNEPPTPEVTTNEEIHIEEGDVKEALRKLKNRKSPGEDGIPNELLKYGGPDLTKQLLKLIQKIIERNRIPQEWRSSILIPLFKKGDKSDPENYRGINLLNTTLKLTTKVITNKLNEILTLAEEQQGFRSGRSCTDAIFIMRQVQEKSLEYNKPAYLCFVDLKKAFDRVKLQDVIHLLYAREIPLAIIKTIENIYQNNTIKVKVEEELTDPIEAGNGIRQGDSLSPLLFNLIMDEIIKKIRTKKGYQMGAKQLKIICYADDAILISQSEDDLQRMLHQFNITAKKFNMLISSKKTKCMVITSDLLRCKLELEGQIIEQVMEFNYLGITLSSYGKLETEVEDQVNRANRAAGCLNETIWRNKNIGKEMKGRIYKAVVRPIMTYAAETRPDTEKTKRMLETAEMKTLRKIDGKTLWDRARSTDIRRRCKVDNIKDWVRNRRVEWNDHISRMTTNRVVKTARDGSPIGRRSVGRPRKRWNDNLLEAH